MSLAVSAYESTIVNFFRKKSAYGVTGVCRELRLGLLCWLYKTYSDIDFSAVSKEYIRQIRRFVFFKSSYIIRNFTLHAKDSDNIMVSATTIFITISLANFLSYKTNFN